MCFTGRHSDYHVGDTFHPSWASDGNLYSPWTDGTTDGVISRSYRGAEAETGQAIRIGDDPLSLIIRNTCAPQGASALPYQGRYPCGSLVHDGIWYYGTYCLGPDGHHLRNGFKFNWPNPGPMCGFRISRDHGLTWAPSPLSPENPLFPEPAEFLGPVRMGAPHCVDSGKNMEHSPDGKAYLLGMGAAADEYFAGHDAEGTARWSRDFADIRPLLDWNNHMGCVTATYVPALKKYLMCVTDGWPTVFTMDSYILEADAITGPWRMVSYPKNLGEQGYFLNFPTKFVRGDGRTLWLCYSANFSDGWNGLKLRFNPPGRRYGLCLHEIRLLAPGELPPSADTQHTLLGG